MAIAQLTHLHISIPASGALPGAIPEDYFPLVQLARVPADSHLVSFASAITILGAEPDLENRQNRYSGSCPSLAAGPGGPVSIGALIVVSALLWGWLCFSEYDVSPIGLRSADWRFWCSDAPSSVLRVDWPAGVCRSLPESVGKRTGDVSEFCNSG